MKLKAKKFSVKSKERKMKTERKSALDENELALINKYTRKPFSGEEVYVFPVTLCDNEVDRDFEQFSVSSLKTLAVLFEGKTGVFDHNAKSTLQTARIFKTFVETDPTRKNSLGEAYTALKAKAYMVRTKENESLIEEIEGGIKKEVSVNCSVSSVTCSICGSDRRKGGCEHRNGRMYDGKLCFSVLNEPADAYEWSFVAVPAQRAAGVTKSYKKEEETTENTIEKIKSAKSSLNLTASQVENLRLYLSELENEVTQTKAYRSSLLEDIRKYAGIAMPKVDSGAFLSGCEKMNLKELITFSKEMKEQAKEFFPAEPQLRPRCEKTKADYSAFQI